MWEGQHFFLGEIKNISLRILVWEGQIFSLEK